MTTRSRHLRCACLGVLVVGMAMCACTAGGHHDNPTSSSPHSSAAIKILDGTVVDQRTGKPIGGARISIGSYHSVTTSDGHFALGNPPEGAPIKVTRKNYALASAAAPTTTPYQITIHLRPLPVRVSIRRNLDHLPLTAKITTAGVVVKANHGLATIFGIGPHDLVHATAIGYAAAEARVPAARHVTLTLQAGPAVTARYLGHAQIAQNYAVQARFTHPDELKYVTRAELTSSFRKSDRDGYSTIRWTFKSVTIIPRWRFPGCDGAGIKTYKQVAAVEYTRVDSAPGGASQTTHGIEHLVQAPDGRWDWFPIIAGCT